MTEEDKKAITQILWYKNLFDKGYCQDCNELCSSGAAIPSKDLSNSIEAVLNPIKSKQKEIEILKSKRVNMFEQLNCIDKKNKIIDIMARFIEERLNECPHDFWIEAEKELNCKNCEEDYAKCWKQYFEKKVEESNVK